MNYSDIIRSGTGILTDAGISEAALDARLLLEFITGCSHADILADPDTEVSGELAGRYDELIKRRADHVPLSQITGRCGFMGIDFFVNDRVLSPRQDSECLVEEAMRYVTDGSFILDLCTGSGCLLLALMHYKNGCTGIGTDISEDALEVAKKNARMLEEEGGLNGGSAQFYCGDLFDALPDTEAKFDAIISNPPYIKSSVIPTLMSEVKDHEPYLALDGGEDGLTFYRRIITLAKDHLTRSGMIFFEIGYDQADDVSRLLADQGYEDINTVRDYCDNDRVIKARWH